MKRWQSKKLLKLFPVLALTFGALTPLSASANTVESCFYEYCTVNFEYTGATESYTFPPNAINVTFEALGAQGGKNGGPGGRVTGSFNTTPTTLYFTVGGAGTSSSNAPGGFNGGGVSGSGAGVEGSGGGASDIRTSPDFATRIVVAGGGGGRGSGLGSSGGAGGGLVSANGKTGQGIGGTGGTQVSGGIGGSANGPGTSGTDGQFGVGGTGGSGPLHGGGGGGGGYYGGGGGGPDADSCCLDAGAGGGGSSYTDEQLVSNVEHVLGFHAGDGLIILQFQIGPSDPPVSQEPEAPPVNPEPEITQTPAPETSAPEDPATEPEQNVTDETSSPDATEQPGVNSPTNDPGEQKQSNGGAAPANPAPTPIATAPQAKKLKTQREISEPASEKLLAPEIEEIEIIPEPEIVQEISPRSDLEQAAATVVVPSQSAKAPFSSNALFAGLLAIGIVALLVGLIVIRRGVPGAIAN